MKGAFLGFLLGALVGAAAHWYFVQPDTASDLETARSQVREGAGKMKESITEQIDKLDTEKIKEGIANTGKAVSDKARQAGQVIADATSDARITATIKAKFAKSSDVSALNIKVSTTDGLVTLSGTAQSVTELAKALEIAQDTEGVRKVRSTIEIGE